jgi:hypothetical protein
MLVDCTDKTSGMSRIAHCDDIFEIGYCCVESFKTIVQINPLGNAYKDMVSADAVQPDLSPVVLFLALNASLAAPASAQSPGPSTPAGRVRAMEAL